MEWKIKEKLTVTKPLCIKQSEKSPKNSVYLEKSNEKVENKEKYGNQ